MSNRFWVGNGGHWNEDHLHWSETSGGAPADFLIPTASDNVFFDSNSFSSAGQTVYTDGDSPPEFLNMDWTGATNSPELGLSFSPLVYGNITFIAAMSIYNAIATRITIKGTCGLTTNGLTLACGLYLNDAASALTLLDNLTMENELYISAGVIDTNNKTVNIASLTTYGASAKTLTLGSSVITITGDVAIVTTGLTVTANTSTLVMTGNTKTFAGGGVTLNKLELQGTPTVISGSNTFGELKLTAAKTVTFTAGTTQTITTFSGDGTSGNLITIQSSSAGSAFTISKASGTVNRYYYSIKDSTASGGATFNAIESTNVSGNTGWVFGTAEGDGSAPTITYPTAETVIVNGNVTFTWTMTGTQSHYDLDYSTNGIVWTNYADKVASGTSSCVVTSGTLTSHIYYWRVRYYSIAGTIVSEYSQASFIAVINPVTSAVTCDLMPMPTVGWTATEQQAFQLMVGTYDTGTIYSATGSYLVPEYFADGTYGITVRTQNNLGVWSAWTDIAYFAIANTAGGAITLTAAQSGNAINLIWTTGGTYSKYYIYRDSVCIADVTDTAYADNFCYGTSIYQVRGILATDYYTLSAEVTQALTLLNDVISLVSTISWIDLKYSLNAPIRHNYADSDNVSYLNFAGRIYPVSAHSEFSNRKGNFNYAFLTLAAVNTVIALKGLTVMLKDSKGNRIIGIINDFSFNTGRKFHDLQFNIMQTDYDETVAYT